MPKNKGYAKTVTLEGSCLCGAVTYTIDGPVKNVSCCHCTQCRKQSGLYFAAVEMPASALTIRGEDHLTDYRAYSDTPDGSYCFAPDGDGVRWRRKLAEQQGLYRALYWLWLAARPEADEAELARAAAKAGS